MAKMAKMAKISKFSKISKIGKMAFFGELVNSWIADLSASAIDESGCRFAGIHEFTNSPIH